MTEIVQYHIWGNTAQWWLAAVALALVTLISFRIVQSLAVKRFRKLAEQTETKLDDMVVEMLAKTRLLGLAVVSVFVGSTLLTLPPVVASGLKIAMIIVALYQAGIWSNVVVGFWISKTIARKAAEDAGAATTLSVLGFISKLAIWAVILLLVLDNIGLNITSLVAGLGIGGIAVALALQNILGDLFASLSIVLDKPFVLGDFIIVDQHLGTVEHIGLKTTRVRSLSGEQLVFSNADLLKSRIRNFKRMYERRVVFSISATYQTPTEKLERISAILREAIETWPKVRFDRAHFKEFGDSGLIYEAVYFVKSPDFNIYMDHQQAINIELVRRFREEGIDFAYPTRTVIMESSSPAGSPGVAARPA